MQHKLAQKEYKNRLDYVKMVIHWELCKKLKFHHTDKWYMHKTWKMKCIRFSGTLRYRWITQSQSEDQTMFWLIIIRELGGFCHTSRPQRESEGRQKAGQISRSCQRTGKIMEHEGDNDTNCRWCTWKGEWGNWRSEKDYTSSRPQHC